MPWWENVETDPGASMARWSGGRKWGDGSRWGTAGTTWAAKTDGPINEFTLAIGGAIQAWSSLSWRTGRSNWFSDLESTNASITVNGYAIPAIGASVVISDADRLYFVGYVESAVADQDTAGNWTTTISAVDTVGRLGKAEVKAASVPEGTLVAQVEYLLGLAGIDVEVTEDVGISLPTLDAVTFTGGVLEHIARAEKSSNALLFMKPNGDLLVTQRVALPDYGARVVSGLYAATPSSHWTLTETASTYADSVAAVTGTVGGTPTRGVEGPWGPDGPVAVQFNGDGTFDRITFGDNYDLTGMTFSIAGWLRSDGQGAETGTVLRKLDGGSGGWQFRVTTTQGLAMSIQNSGGTTVTVETEDDVVPSDGSWVHIAGVVTPTTIELFVNGTSVASDSHAMTMPNTAENLTMSYGGLELMGALAQFSIWDGTALTVEEIQTLMAGPSNDLSDDASPSRWSVSLNQDGIYNSWRLTKADTTAILTEDDADSIAAYGLRAFTMEDFLADVATHFPSGLREALTEPRLVLTGAPFPVRGYESHRVLGLAPMDIVSRDGVAWQIMSTDHNVTPSAWTVTITGDSTRDGLVSQAIDLTPPPPASSGTHTETWTVEATRDSTAYRTSGGAYYGNGTGNRLQVGLYSGGRGRAFIRFPIDWPVGFVRVKSAKLKLRTSGQDWVAFGSHPRMYVYRVTESWSEGTYDASPPNQFSSNALVWPGPSVTGSGSKTKDVTRSENTWIEIAITDIAQDWHDKGNDGLSLRSVNEDSSSRTTEFYSRESGSEPRLVLVCEVED